MNYKHIAIDLTRISHRTPTGVFVYVQNLLDNLLRIDKYNKYSLLLRLGDLTYFRKRYKKNKNIGFKVVDVRRDLFFNPLRACLKIIAKIKEDSAAKGKILKKEIQNFVDGRNINLLFFPSTIIYPRGIKNVKIVATICDLQHEYFPENFPPEYLEFRNENYRYAAEKSDKIIAISDYTRETIIEKYHIDSNKINTIYLGANYKEIKTSNITLPENFILYPAALWPHKNHSLLVKAMEKIKGQFPDLHIVFTGAIKNYWLKEKIENIAKKLGLMEKVVFLGHIADDNLHYAYQKAKALVFPSSFEGFGLPIIEAFKHKLPVIAADNTSISEIVKDAGLLFETNNLEMLVDCIKKILTDRGLRERLANNGFERAKSFTWENTALKTLSLFNEL